MSPSMNEEGPLGHDEERVPGEGPSRQDAAVGLPQIRELRGGWFFLVAGMALSFSLFQLYTSIFGVLLAYQQRIVHLTLAMAMGFLLYPFRSKKRDLSGLDIMAGLGVFGILGYIFVDFRAFAFRAGDPSTVDILLGLIYLLMILELTRRIIGYPMFIIAVAFLLYALLGRYAPLAIAHRGVDVSRLVDHMFMGTEGIFGIPVGVSATYISIFVLFGTFLEVTKQGKFFIDLALSLVGRAVGGPAKSAVISSAMMGTISGSSIANVVTTGTFTIPLMIRNGYRPFFAAAVEAAASTGGQIMPPIMGAAAFIMVEYTGIKYQEIALAAAIPAVLYFLGVYFSVHLEAKQLGLEGLREGEVPRFWELLLRDGHLFLPLIVLVYSLAIGNTPMRAGVLGIFAAVLASFVKRWTRLDLRRLYQALRSGATNMIPVAIACAAAGIIAGAISITGIGLKLAGLVETIAGGHLWIALILTMVASLILGMGLPTTATYIVLVTIVAPALTRMGVPLLGAHLFVFYYGVVADITPPVALAAYAGAGLARANVFKTGVMATMVAIAGFLIPYVFIYAPSMILIGKEATLTWCLGFGWTVISAGTGLWMIASAIVGFSIRPLSIPQRVSLIIGGLLLVKPGLITDATGIGILIGILIWQKFQGSRESAKGNLEERFGNKEEKRE
jgi:TRAP transporter 4TM/12TM fusion protein